MTTFLASVRKWSKFYKRSSKSTTLHTPSAARYPSMFSQKAGTRLSAFSLSKRTTTRFTSFGDKTYRGGNDYEISQLTKDDWPRSTSPEDTREQVVKYILDRL